MESSSNLPVATATYWWSSGTKPWRSSRRSSARSSSKRATPYMVPSCGRATARQQALPFSWTSTMEPRQQTSAAILCAPKSHRPRTVLRLSLSHGRASRARRGAGPQENFIIFDSKLFFSAETDGRGKELWSTDGTVSGTAIVKTTATLNSDGDVVKPLPKSPVSAPHVHAHSPPPLSLCPVCPCP